MASLADVERLVAQWSAQVDPATLTGQQAAEVTARLAPVIRQLSAVQASVGARVEQCHSHDKRFCSTVDWMARLNGSSFGEAKRVVDTARALKQFPQTAEAFRAGDLSGAQAAAIAAAAAIDPSAEADLVERAVTTRDLVETRERADKVKAAARHGEDPAVRRGRLRARRRWAEFNDDEMVAVAGRFSPEDFAMVRPVIDAFNDAAFEQARHDGRRDSTEAYRSDGVLAALAAAGEAIGITLDRTTETARPAEPTQTAPPDADAESDATAATVPTTTEAAADEPSELDRLLQVRPGRVKWTVTILVDAIALKRGYATASETCEIPGVGPVDARWVSRILPDAMVDVLVHDLKDIRSYATITRKRKKALDRALKARDRRCVVPGCRRRIRLEADHRHDFAKLGPTSGANMQMLCPKHHDEKTHRGARIVRTDAEWHWYPPRPKPGEPEPSPGSIPWKASIGEHLNPFDLTDLPDDIDPDPEQMPDDQLPFG